jgi:hypothetical protein
MPYLGWGASGGVGSGWRAPSTEHALPASGARHGARGRHQCPGVTRDGRVQDAEGGLTARPSSRLATAHTNPTAAWSHRRRYWNAGVGPRDGVVPCVEALAQIGAVVGIRFAGSSTAVAASVLVGGPPRR